MHGLKGSMPMLVPRTNTTYRQMQIQADADYDMLFAAVCNRTSVQLLLDAEQQKHQNVERVITDLRRCVRHNSRLVDLAKASLHFEMPHGYEECL